MTMNTVSMTTSYQHKKYLSLVIRHKSHY